MKYPGCAPDYDYFCVAMSSIFGNLFLIIIIGVPVLVGLFIWKWIKKESDDSSWSGNISPRGWFTSKKKKEVKVEVEEEEEEKQGFGYYFFVLIFWGVILEYFFDIEIFEIVFQILSSIVQRLTS